MRPTALNFFNRGTGGVVVCFQVEFAIAQGIKGLQAVNVALKSAEHRTPMNKGLQMKPPKVRLTLLPRIPRLTRRCLSRIPLPRKVKPEGKRKPPDEGVTKVTDPWNRKQQAQAPFLSAPC